ncbi:hypothetical protein QBC37DRAFT_371676 [Rhypophila decipiens]|uniref:Signal peptide-containing protein n=1 Tax=Rhypophila decipiens TaxID=261697 RepID=A0AAN7B9S2_9PEZI|nr:hypothetical protein QBC37DRAFT_371676 [Rhypophila decipiens]
MQLINFPLLALFAASGAFALPTEQNENAAGMTARHVEGSCLGIFLPLCAGARDIGTDNCKCSGMVAPCRNWKCPWDGPRSIMNCDSAGNGCQWVN